MAALVDQVKGKRQQLAPSAESLDLRAMAAAQYANTDHDTDYGRLIQGQVDHRAAQESEIPNFKGSDLGYFPLVSADFWTSDHLLERSRSVDAFPGTRARGKPTLKRC